MTGEDNRTGEPRRADDWTAERIVRTLRFVLVVVAALFVLLLAVGTIGFVRIDNAADDARAAANDATIALMGVKGFAGDIRDAAVSGCQRQNRVRKRQHEVQDILREILHDTNYDARHPDPAVLELLGLTMEDVEGVSDRQIAQNQGFRQQLNHKLALAPCQAVYPSAEASSDGD